MTERLSELEAKVGDLAESHPPAGAADSGSWSSAP